MTENIPDTDEGSPKGRIDVVGWQKIGKGAVIASAGGSLGGLTANQFVQIAIEQHWLAATMPSDQPATFTMIVVIAGVLWSVLIQVARKWLTNYPAVEAAIGPRN